ncbi:FtsJ-like methyltransferase [Hokovirus HKV1]|mgnify:CR=1 FL=1|uniref:FtsJ-like methyltransferase n=1 Tax=Hokovirus HKV1 TaxID=1977638 RepID=A0A1V0SH33_9VIRU|nr:FtsJ-like methyltransferase [Hokovirus HKV1]
MELLTQFIKNKYTLSKKIYNIILNEEPENIYLFYFDVLNVYGLFPTIIDYKLPQNELNEIQSLESINNSLDEKFVKINKKYKKKFKDTVKKMTNYEENEKDFIYTRKFFSYEIIDHIVEKYNGEYVTVAWLKCYEIIEWYNLIKDQDTVNYFGICEQPGAFVYAINHYIKTKTQVKNYNFILQSLKTNITSRKTGFKAEETLSKEYYKNYDYGKSNGDVTNLENIKYYRQKYYDTNFNLISADCGIDSSDDFTLQEKKIFKIFYGQILLAISLASKGTNYFAKLFTIYELSTASLINLLTKLFEDVFLCRVLTTKSTSGEIYCICKNFKYSKEFMDKHLLKLYSLYEQDLVPNFDSDDIFKEINIWNETLLYRRIISYRASYFRYINRNYTTENKLVIDYIKDIVEHYKNYYINHYKLLILPNDKKLVSKKFINKWIKNN